MNTSFKEWLELQEISSAELAMMMGAALPGQAKTPVVKPLMIQAQEARSIASEIKDVTEKVVKLQQVWPETKQKIMLSLQNKQIHPIDVFAKLLSDPNTALKRISSIENMEQKLDLIEDTLGIVNTNIQKLQNDILEGPADEKNLDMQTRMKLREKRIDNLRILSNTLDNVQRFVKDYSKAAITDEEQAELDEKTIQQLDVLSVLNLEMLGKLIRDLTR
jgi:hypothetical protein